MTFVFCTPRRSCPPATAIVFLAALAALLPGCSSEPVEMVPVQFTAADVPPEDTLKRRLDETLDMTFYGRNLSTTRHAAWQVLHGALAFGQRFEVEHKGQMVPAVKYLLEGGALDGWILQPAEKGLTLPLGEGTITGQGHPDQWLAVLSQCDLEVDQPLILGGRQYTLQDMVRQAQWELYQGKEASWTIIALSRYLPMDATWNDRDGNEWTLERIMAMEADYRLGEGACGGTHRLIGMTMALDRYRKKYRDAALDGGWKAADERIRQAIATARAHQQPSGAFSTDYFDRPSNLPDKKEQIGATGHTLELLALALDDETIKAPWMAKAALYLCDQLERVRNEDFECGALYHAVHGLALYRQRLFGKKSYPKT